MIILNKKNIHRWEFWRTKSKFIYCLASGFIFASFMFLGSLFFRLLTGKTENMISSGFSVALGAFIVVAFLSIAHWYENERRYQEWMKDNKK
ncbi:MAG: hypothetical protein V2I54_14320 [Bacteroidales bacterium]|nr:hypothetical protein [Bacteroidales bacterium]